MKKNKQLPDLLKLVPDEKDKNFLPFVFSFLILSVFVGIFISLLVRQWTVGKFKYLQEVMAQEEVRRMDQLLNSNTTVK